MSEMVKYKGSVLLKRPKSGPVYHHLWHSPLCKKFVVICTVNVHPSAHVMWFLNVSTCSHWAVTWCTFRAEKTWNVTTVFPSLNSIPPWIVSLHFFKISSKSLLTQNFETFWRCQKNYLVFQDTIYGNMYILLW